MKLVQTIQKLYELYNQGNIQDILSLCSETIEWEYGIRTTNVPWLKTRWGLQGVTDFFASLKEVEIHQFSPKEFLEGQNVVVVLLDVELTVKTTGKRVSEEDEIHVWRFDPEGKIFRFRHGVDSYGHQLAFEN